MRIGRSVPGSDRSFAQRFARIGNDQIHIDIDDVAKAFAFGARAQGAVEAIKARLGAG